MTAIVGLAQGGRVYIGGDSAGVAGYQMVVRSDTKVFRTGPYLFGFTTSFRMGQLLHHAFQPPEPAADIDRFMSTTFIDAVRECLKAGGWATKSEEQERGGVFLLGVAGRLFRIDSDYQVGENADGYDAIGSGDDVALGAMYATAADKKPKRRVRTALMAAERFNSGVRSPFTIRSV